MKSLTHKTTIAVRFSEVDSLQIVWHGHFVKYFEDGREAFGKKYGLGYMQVYAEGYAMPIVNVTCNYKTPIRYGDEVEIETKFIDTPAAKIIFEYTIFNKTTGKISAMGKTTQVFLAKSGELQLTIPPFHQQWKDKWLEG